MPRLVADAYGCKKACTPPYTSPCTLIALQHTQRQTARGTLKWHFAPLSTLQHLNDADDLCTPKLVTDSYGCLETCAPPYTSPCTLIALQHTHSLTARGMLKWHFASLSTLQHLGDVDDPCMPKLVADAYGCTKACTPSTPVQAR